MKHQEYNGYPVEFHNLCREGKAEVYLHAYQQQRKQFKDIDRFFTELEQHGYDVIKPGDGFAFKKTVADMNDVIRREAVRYGHSSYEHLLVDDEICRCGKWLFLLRSAFLSEKKEVEIELKGRGGKRVGSGRQSIYDKLYSNDTAVIRVPKFEKEKIKSLVDWLVEIAAEGKDLKSALYTGLYHLKTEAEECATVAPDISKQLLEEKELLEKLWKKLPSFSIKEENRV